MADAEANMQADKEAATGAAAANLQTDIDAVWLAEPSALNTAAVDYAEPAEVGDSEASDAEPIQ